MGVRKKAFCRKRRKGKEERNRQIKGTKRIHGSDMMYKNEAGFIGFSWVHWQEPVMSLLTG